MYSDAPYIIAVCFERVHSLQCIIIKNPHLHIIGPSHHPILSGHKLGSSDWQIAYLERLHQTLGLVIPDVDVTLVQRAQHPWLCWMEIDTLNSVRSRCQSTLYVQT